MISMKKLEKQVKHNCVLLESKIPKLLKTNKNQYVVFHNGKQFIKKTLHDSIECGIKEFGDDVGFAVKKITKIVPVMSTLIKL